MFIAVFYRELAKAYREATENLWEKTGPALVPTAATTQPVLRTELVVQQRLEQQGRLAERPAPEVRAWQLVRLALVFAARVAQRLIP